MNPAPQIRSMRLRVAVLTTPITRRINNFMTKKTAFYRIVLLAALTAIPACKEDAITDSGIEIPAGPQTDLDKWIDATFRIPYNVHVEYLWDNTVSDPLHIVVPPREDLVQPFLKAVLKIWLTPYVRVADTREEFMKNYICRELILVGSGSYTQGAVMLGLAENAYRITLYTVNKFDLEGGGVSRDALKRFFQTMHHEFGHVLNQRKPYDPKFQQITGNYSADWTAMTDAEARELGFITAYARSADMEDFVEVLSNYIISTETEWQEIINSIKNEQAKEYIRLKLQNISSYMNNTYGVDLRKLRDEVATAVDEVAKGDLEVRTEN
jgi:substrate import-associated zinc metallohydrolase lipoprotein